jgi:hypothetical protein
MNNRQNGRRRGRGGQQARNGQPGPGNGSRLDNRARGNAAQLLEKYKNLARDAQMSSDRVNTEYYLQFADHYFRVLNENRARFEDQRPQRNGDYRDEFSDDDGDAVQSNADQSAADDGWDDVDGDLQQAPQSRQPQRNASPRPDRNAGGDRNAAIDRGAGNDRNSGNDRGPGERAAGGERNVGGERAADGSEQAGPRRRERTRRPAPDAAVEPVNGNVAADEANGRAAFAPDFMSQRIAAPQEPAEPELTLGTIETPTEEEAPKPRRRTRRPRVETVAEAEA